MAQLPVEMVPLNELKLADRNPNIGDVGAITESIELNGWHGVLVANKRKGVNTSNMIMAGNHRLKALKAKGGKEVPVYWVDKSDEEFYDAMLADNRASALAYNDQNILAELLKEAVSRETLPNTLYDGDDLDTILSDLLREDSDLLDDKYSQVKGKVTYEPKESNHPVSELFKRDTKFDDDIDKLTNEELKVLLKARTVYFSDWDFAKIADFYAYQATEEEQRLIEKLGLVLLDKNQLIQNGFSEIIESLTK